MSIVLVKHNVKKTGDSSVNFWFQSFKKYWFKHEDYFKSFDISEVVSLTSTFDVSRLKYACITVKK